MAAVAAIQITVDGQGAVSAINNVKNEVQAMGPAFQAVGGFVNSSMSRSIPGFAPAMHFASGGAVPALLHAGEFVMRPEAVQRIGRRRLEVENNAGRGFGDGIHVHLNVNALEPRSFEQYLAGDGGRALYRSIQNAIAEGRL